jgi:hypothetical protein
MHVSASKHAVPSDTKPFGGQVNEVPVQVAATLHTFVDRRHTVPAGRGVSVMGQLAEVPLHNTSPTMHGPSTAAHARPAGANPSGGQAAAVPVQVSATSHGPAAARHTVPAFPAVWVHVPAPSHASMVHGFPSLAQAVPAGAEGFEHTPVVGLQTPATWQVSSAPQTTGAPATHVSLSQCSIPLQGSPSAQSASVTHAAQMVVIIPPLVVTAGFTQLFSTSLCGEPPSGHGPAFLMAASNLPCAFVMHDVSRASRFVAAFE